jgi:hypothetical protein
MPPDKPATAYAAMAAEAEAAVAAVKDPELRAVAFEKILSTLLEGHISQQGSKVTKRTGTTGTPTATSQERKGETKKPSGPKAYVEALIDEGFFEKQRTIADVKAELANGGRHIAVTSLSGPLQALTRERRLRRQKGTANDSGTKTTYAYSNW